MKVFIFLLIFISSDICAKKSESILVIDYLSYPPYQMKDKGLTKDFTSLLRIHLPDVSVEYLKTSKERLKVFLKERNTIIVPFTSKNWFKESIDYSWSNTLITDKAFIISHKDFPLEVKDILKGSKLNLKLIFGGVFNYKYLGIDELIDKKILGKMDCKKTSQCLELIGRKRADFTILSKPIFYQYLKQTKFKNTFHVSKENINKTNRQMLMYNTPTKLNKKISKAISKIKTSKRWRTLLKTYHIE